MNKKNIGDIIAYWNVEHTKADRKAHLDKTVKFLEDTGLDRVFDVKDVSCPEWDNKPSLLGYPKTRIDLCLKAPYTGRVYRHSETKARVKGLSVIHLNFAKTAGVYSYERHTKEIQPMTSKRVFSEKQARAISNWKGWDDTVCECSLRTNAKYCAYKCRSWTGFDGERPGDSYNYAQNWNDVHDKAFDAVYRMVHKLGIDRP